MVNNVPTFERVNRKRTVSGTHVVGKECAEAGLIFRTGPGQPSLVIDHVNFVSTS